MKAQLLILMILVLPVLSCRKQIPADYAIVIHGGAGSFSPDRVSPGMAEGIEGALREALDLGLQILDGGGSSLDAVEQVIILLEDSPHFNAGKGAVFTHEGRNELDASIMDGATLNTGAVAAVGDIRNPIKAARVVMEQSGHVLLMGAGASEFAASHGIEIVDSSYFFTERRWNSLKQQLGEGSDEHGTVGCVALDRDGNLAAGTSTGGMTNKRFGRVGDSPIAGAGNYASNKTCAVSGTGHGEYFIRYTVAYDISAMMEYAGLPVVEAARIMVHEKLKEAGGAGGVICLDRHGNIAMEYNTAAMVRAYGNSLGEREVILFD